MSSGITKRFPGDVTDDPQKYFQDFNRLDSASTALIPLTESFRARTQE